MIKKLFKIIFILLLLSCIPKNILAITLKEVEPYFGKTVLIIHDIGAINPCGTFCEIIDTVVAKDGDMYIMAHLFRQNTRELRWIRINTVLKIREWEKVIYESTWEGISNSKESLKDRLSPEYIRKKYSW